MMKNFNGYYDIANGQIREASIQEAYYGLDDKKCLKSYTGTINREEGVYLDISLNFLTLPAVENSEKLFFELFGSLKIRDKKKQIGPLRFGLYATAFEANKAFDSFLENPLPFIEK